MRTTDAIRHMCDSAGKGTIAVSRELGRSDGYVGGILSRGTTPQADTLARIARACGWRLVLERVEVEPE